MKPKLLDQIRVPADVRRLSRVELQQLATELREFIVQTVSQTGGEIDMSLSLRTTSMTACWPWCAKPALLSASYAMPALIAPSPMTATHLRASPFIRAATAMPSAAEIEVDEWAVPKVSNSLSSRRGKPEMPPSWRRVDIRSLRPVIVLCG